MNIFFAYKRVFPLDQPEDAEVSVNKDGQGNDQLDHRLQDRVVEQLVIESKLLADLRENLDYLLKRIFLE